MSIADQSLLTQIKQCDVCSPYFSHQPNPVFQVGPKAKVLIAGQAPGRIVHDTGVPFDDASGKRLRAWMGVTSEAFYDVNQVAILPMAFCYPGKGKSGDLPPRKECASLWRQQVLNSMPDIKFILVIGRYAIDWHLAGLQKKNLTETVKAWQSYAPDLMPLPHPSPRNNIWLQRNPWFERELVPVLQTRIGQCLGDPS